MVIAVEYSYQQQESDLEPGTYESHDVDAMFDTSVESIPTAVAAAQRGCELAIQIGYTCDTLIGNTATVQEVRNYLLSNRLKAMGNIGHGYEQGIFLKDGELSFPWFNGLPYGELNGIVLYFNSCRVHNIPLEASIMNTGARTFIGGTVNLPIGQSEEVFKCFWNDILKNQEEMGAALAKCEVSNGLVGYHGISGDTGIFSGSLVGDKDEFHEGDLADIPFKSPRVEQLLQTLIATVPGQHAAVNLDVDGFDRPVGWTHQFPLPNDALITSATLKLRLRGNNTLVSNDELLYEETALGAPFLPFIALQDLNRGIPPTMGDFELTINLAKVPVRIRCPECAPGANLAPFQTQGTNPNGEFRNLLPLLFDGQFDLVLADDATVDYSELQITYVLPSAPPGDLDGNGSIDQKDVDILMQALNTAAYTERRDPRDLDGDGKITVLDARKLVRLCSKPRCAL